MDIGYIGGEDMLRGLEKAGLDGHGAAQPAEALWEEHGWALTGPQVAAALSVVVLGCLLGTLIG